jgi:hypothetical protein
MPSATRVYNAAVKKLVKISLKEPDIKRLSQKEGILIFL